MKGRKSARGRWREAPGGTVEGKRERVDEWKRRSVSRSFRSGQWSWLSSGSFKRSYPYSLNPRPCYYSLCPAQRNTNSGLVIACECMYTREPGCFRPTEPAIRRERRQPTVSFAWILIPPPQFRLFRRTVRAVGHFSPYFLPFSPISTSFYRGCCARDFTVLLPDLLPATLTNFSFIHTFGYF